MLYQLMQKVNLIFYKLLKYKHYSNSKKAKKKNDKLSVESSENDNQNKKRNNIYIFSKSKDVKDLNSSSNILIANSKANKMFKKDNDILKFKNKSNSIANINNLEKFSEIRKEELKTELKKINQFKKVITRNSKVITQKYGKELLRKTTLLPEEKKSYRNRGSSLSIKLMKKRNAGYRYSKFSSNIAFKKNENNIITDIKNEKNNEIKINIKNKNNNNANNKIINNNNANKNNSNKNINVKNYSLKNVNVNIINSFKIINNNETVKRRHSCMLLYKIKPIKNQITHRSYKNAKFPFLDKKIEINQKKQSAKKNNKFDLNTFQISKNISLNFNRDIKNNNKNNKFLPQLKIGFYSLLVSHLFKNNYKSIILGVEKNEQIEEDKRIFLFQLFYCLELSKIYILNFKKKKPSSSKSLISSPKEGQNAQNSEDIHKFRHFYEIFSEFSALKISSQKKYEAYPNIEHINNYYIFKDKQIGKGGSSVVYLGEDEKQRRYAIKVTPKNLKANPSKKIYDYVKDEVSILKRIHSKYIVTTYEVIESRNKIYIIMEYMSAGSVLNILELMDENKIKQYTRDLICAVEHCHEIAKVIHKDINVNNILINQDGFSKLCDFGISETFEEDNDLLLSKGPSTYTPPEKKCYEKYKGKPADIYLIGLTLYHMIYKKPLFTDFGNLTNNDYMNITIPKKDHKNRDINNDLYNLLESLLKYNPEERPTIPKLKKDPWLTNNMKNPFPDIIREALFYSLELTKRQIKLINEQNQGKNNNNDSSSLDDEENKDNKENEVEEESSEDDSDSSSKT